MIITSRVGAVTAALGTSRSPKKKETWKFNWQRVASLVVWLTAVDGSYFSWRCKTEGVQVFFHLFAAGKKEESLKKNLNKIQPMKFRNSAASSNSLSDAWMEHWVLGVLGLIPGGAAGLALCLQPPVETGGSSAPLQDVRKSELASGGGARPARGVVTNLWSLWHE